VLNYARLFDIEQRRKTNAKARSGGYSRRGNEADASIFAICAPRAAQIRGLLGLFRGFQTYPANAQDLGSFVFFRVLSHVLAFFFKKQSNYPWQPLEKQRPAKMPRKTMDRSGNSDFSTLHHCPSVESLPVLLLDKPRFVRSD